MVGAIRVVSVERGHDPRRFAYMPFGGGGALHVCAMMREVGVGTGIVPRYPGVFSAIGLLVSDVKHDYIQSKMASLTELAARDVDAMFARLAAQAAVELRADGFSDAIGAGIRHLSMLNAEC